jgi:hypothetical protein
LCSGWIVENPEVASAMKWVCASSFVTASFPLLHLPLYCGMLRHQAILDAYRSRRAAATRAKDACCPPRMLAAVAAAVPVRLTKESGYRGGHMEYPALFVANGAMMAPTDCSKPFFITH